MAMKYSTEELLDAFANMTVMELSEFAKAFEEKFDVEAAAAVAMPAMAVGGAAAAAEEEEQTEFSVYIKDPGASKINVLKEVRAITNLPLKEAKELVEDKTKPVKEKISKEEAEEIKKKLEAAGAVVEIK